MSTSFKERREKILQLITINEEVKISDLSQLFNVSEISIRRDLIGLESENLLKRTYGGAISTAKVIQEQSFKEKINKHLEEKKRIAAFAVKMIQRGDRILLDSGTTTLQIARMIKNPQELTVVTTSLPIAEELGIYSGINLILTGGIYNPTYQSLVGPLTVKNLTQFHVNKVFMGIDGLSISNGLTTISDLEAEVRQAILQIAGEVIVVADHSKIGRIGFAHIASIAKIHKLITDEYPDTKDFIKDLEDKGIEVLLA